MNIEQRQISSFLGQRSADDPGSLYINKGVMAAQTNSFLLTKGRKGLDGQTGIGDNLATNSTTGLAGYGVRQYEWLCGDGNTYHLFYLRAGTTGSVAYFKNGVRTGAPTALTYTDISGAALTPVVPLQTVPSWGVYGGCLYLAMGQPGVFRITAKNGTLTAQLTTAPASSKMLIVDSRMWVAVGDEPIIRWSALGDVERFTPKLAEIEANTYGIDYRVTLQSQGAAGNIVDCKMFGKAKVWWTQNECFVIYGDGDSSSTVFDKIGSGMGCNGQPIVYDNACYWPSKYKGGSWLALTFGSSVVGGKEIDVQDEKNIGFRTFDAGSKIADVLQAMPQTTIANAVVGWDTRPDWEAIPTAQRVSLSTTYDPGYIGVQVRDNNIPFNLVVQTAPGWASASNMDHVHDSLPAYSSTTAPSVTSGVWTFSGTSMFGDVTVTAIKPDGTKLVEQIFDGTASIATWKYLDANAVVGYVLITIRGWDSGSSRTVKFNCNVNAYVTTVRFLLSAFSTVSKTFTMDEIRIEGNTATTATLYTEAPTATSKAVLTGLTANSNIDFGRFFPSYVGTDYDGTGGITFFIRAGWSAHVVLASGTGTVSGTTLTGDGDNFGTLGVNKGDIITIASVDYIVATVGTTTLTTTTAPGDGSKAYSVVGGAKASWSDWTAVIANNLLTGYDLKSLVYFGTSTSVKTDTAGTVLYVQAYATFTVTNGISPKLDAMFFTAHTGSNLTFAPSGFYDDKVFTCILSNSSSTSPDCELVKYLDGEHSVIPGKRVNSYLNTSDGDCLVCEGYAVGKQLGGIHNFISTDNTTETRLSPEWLGEEHTGLLYSGRLKVDVGAFSKHTSTAMANITLPKAYDVINSIQNDVACTPPVTTGQFSYGYEVQHTAVDEYGTVWICFLVGGKVYVAETSESGAYTNVYFLWSQADLLAPHNSYQYLVFTIVADKVGKVWIFAAPNKNSSPPAYTSVAYATVDVRTGEINNSSFSNPETTAGLSNTGTTILKGFLYDGRIYLGMLVRDAAITNTNFWLYAFDGGTPTTTNLGEYVAKIHYFTAASGNLGEIRNNTATTTTYYTEYGGTSVTLSDDAATRVYGIATGTLDYLFYFYSSHLHYKYGTTPATLSDEQTIFTTGYAPSSVVCAELDSNNILVLWNHTDGDVYYAVVKEAAIVVAATKLFAAGFPNTAPNMSIIQDGADKIYLAILDQNVGTDSGATHLYRIISSDLDGNLIVRAIIQNGKKDSYISNDTISKPTLLPETRRMKDFGKTESMALKIIANGRASINSIAYTISEGN